MNKLIMVCLGILLGGIYPGTPVFSQAWQWQNPLPQGNPLFAIDFVDSLNGWMAGGSGTLIHTTDGGETWEVQVTEATDIFYDLDFIDTQTGWGVGGISEGGVIVRTTTGGKSWQVSFLDTLTVGYEAITFVDPQHGWAVGRKGAIAHTRDGGQTWQRQESGTTEKLNSVSFVDTLHGWAIGDLAPLLMTNDGGQTWVSHDVLSRGRRVVFADSLRGWLLLFPFPDVARSIDGGKTWTLSLSAGGSDHGWDMVFLDSLRGWVTRDGGVSRTLDGGESWQGLAGPEWHRILFLNDGMTGWGAGGFKFAVTRDGGDNWEERSSVITTARLSSVDFVNESEGWLVGEDVIEGGVILHSEDGGRSWEFQDGGPSNVFQDVFFLDERRGWCVGNTIIYTEDGGETWLEQSTDASGWAIHFVDERRGWTVGLKVENSIYQGKIFHTDDGGRTWIEQTPDGIPRLRDVVFVDSLNGWVVAGNRGLPIEGGGIWHTRDGGRSWESQFTQSDLRLFGVDFVDVSTGWAVGLTEELDSMILHTENGGETWASQYFGDRGVTDVQFLNEKQGWAIASGVLLYTENGGTNWEEFFSPASGIANLDFVNENSGWLIGSGGKILHTTTGGVTSIEPEPNRPVTPNAFVLHQNYPNPFNPQTTIEYQIPKRALITIKIYNLMGEEIVTLLNEESQAGYSKVIWDGRDSFGKQVASGIYVYQMRAGDFVASRKLLLLR